MKASCCRTHSGAAHRVRQAAAGAPQADSGQGFEFVGTLSSLFSSWYLSSTSDADRVTRLGITVTGGSLGSLIPDDYHSDTLPLWRMRQVPEPRRSGAPA